MKKLILTSLLILAAVFCITETLAEPYFAIDSLQEWQTAMQTGHIQPMTTFQWYEYMEKWMTQPVEGEPYPTSTYFMQPSLHLYEGEPGNPDYPEGPGLVMEWGEPQPPAGQYASAWIYEYGLDPDLTNSIISITVFPPSFGATGKITNISLGIRDINGKVRSWHWTCPVPIPNNMPTTITINTAITGLASATPNATGYFEDPGFDITKVIAFIFDENAQWVGGPAPVPPPGSVDPRPWNYWQNLSVKQNQTPGGLVVGCNFEAHQDIMDPTIQVNDYHVEFKVISFDPQNPSALYPPKLLSHVDDIFMMFNWSYVHLGNGLYLVTMDWSFPPNSIPYCTYVHLGFELEVIAKNVAIDVIGWWTYNGIRVGNLPGAQLINGGFTPVIGFAVNDGQINPPPIIMQNDLSDQSIRLQNGNLNGIYEEGEIPVSIVQFQVAHVNPLQLNSILGEYPFGQLNRDSFAQQQLPWKNVLAGGVPVSPNNPIEMMPDSFFDIFLEMNVEGGPISLQSGDFLIARQVIQFVNNSGMADQVWSWDIHEAENGQSDLGDAPDSTNTAGAPMTAYPSGAIAQYPTVYAAGSPPYGPLHLAPDVLAYLGSSFTREQEADFGFDQDPTNNIRPVANIPDLDFADDGLLNLPLSLPNCKQTTFQYKVNTVTAGATMYFNAWADFNRDGDWNDTLQCANGTIVPEWIVQDKILTGLPAGISTQTTPPFASIDPPVENSKIWLRITLSESKWAGTPGPNGGPLIGGSGPMGGYQFGETEDYYFLPQTSTGCDCADFDGDNFVNFTDLVFFASQWLQTCP